MIWNNEDNLRMYVGRRIIPEVYDELVSRDQILPPLVDVVGLTCGATNSKLYFIQGKDMKVRELTQAKYHKNSKHITIETVFKIYTTDKKALFDYYKKQFHKGIQHLETYINMQTQIANTALNGKSTISDIHYALETMQIYRELKVQAMNKYRQTIEAIKKQ